VHGDAVVHRRANPNLAHPKSSLPIPYKETCMRTHRVPDFDAPVEGELTSVTVAGRAVTVTVAGGEFYAFDDTCTHLQCSLVDGEVEGRSVVCPCHSGTFDVTTGMVISGPPKIALRTYPARLVGGALELDVAE
jgi:nitrite reductase/ring-hydroxylating ferredoxin subunit